MRALVLEGRVRVWDSQPAPRAPEGEALLRVRLAGICDTDLQLAQGYLGFRGVLGHEFVGEVLEHPDPGWRGLRVVGDINAGCGKCARCRAGDSHHCATRTVLGIVGRSGALAERVSLPLECLVPVPASVADERAVFAEPLAAALHVLDALEGRAPSRACVLGDGKLGILCAWALHAEGWEVLLVGHHERKLALAAKPGLGTRLEADLGEQQQFPLVVEATGNAAGLAKALSLTEPRGTVVLKTTVARKLEVDLAPVVIHELRVVGSRCGDLRRAVAAMALGKLDPTPLIEGVYGLTEGEAAMERAARRGALKVLVDPRR